MADCQLPIAQSLFPSQNNFFRKHFIQHFEKLLQIGVLLFAEYGLFYFKGLIEVNSGIIHDNCAFENDTGVGSPQEDIFR